MSLYVNFVLRTCDRDSCSMVLLYANGIYLYHPVTVDFSVTYFFSVFRKGAIITSGLNCWSRDFFCSISYRR